MIIEIEKGVPIPPENKRGRQIGTYRRYPLTDMEPGDSFLIVGAVKGNVWMCVKAFRKRHKTAAEFTTRVVPEGIRVWRTA